MENEKPKVLKTISSVLRDRLRQLTYDKAFMVSTESHAILARRIARELNIAIRVLRVPEGYVVRLFRQPHMPFISQEEKIEWERAELLRKEEAKPTPLVKVLEATASPFNIFTRHWDSKATPIGRSGTPLHALAWKEVGHANIPQEWLVADREFKVIFRPHNITSPKQLTNKFLLSLGAPATTLSRFVHLDESLSPVTVEESNHREEELFNTKQS